MGMHGPTVTVVLSALLYCEKKQTILFAQRSDCLKQPYVSDNNKTILSRHRWGDIDNSVKMNIHK